MELLSNLQTEQFKQILLNNKTLLEKFEDYIISTEMSYIDDKLSCFTYKSADWSIGIYNNNYLQVKSPKNFLESVEKSISYYGGSDELLQQLEKCNNTDDIYCLEKDIEELCNLYFNTELISVIKYTEDVYYSIHNKQLDKSEEYLEPFQENLSNYIFYNNKVYKEIL